MRLSERFVDNCILINSPCETKEAILNELVDTLCSAYKLEHRDEIFEAVWNREKTRSTGIGCGLAVPHAKIDYVDRMCMVAATIPKGLDFDSFDGDRPGVPRKPDPAHVRFVMEKMGVAPEETVYLGDSGVDMQTAINAGNFPIGVLWGFRDKEELLENGAKVLLSHPSELFEKVDFGRENEE